MDIKIIMKKRENIRNPYYNAVNMFICASVYAFHVSLGRSLF